MDKRELMKLSRDELLRKIELLSEENENLKIESNNLKSQKDSKEAADRARRFFEAVDDAAKH